jgi:hypothetical protein
MCGPPEFERHRGANVLAGPNRGRRRSIEPASELHVSVLDRMNRLGYAPGNLPKQFGVEN